MTARKSATRRYSSSSSRSSGNNRADCRLLRELLHSVVVGARKVKIEQKLRSLSSQIVFPWIDKSA